MQGISLTWNSRWLQSNDVNRLTYTTWILIKKGETSTEYRIIDIEIDKLYMGYSDNDYKQEIKFKESKSESSDDQKNPKKKQERRWKTFRFETGKS